MAQTKNLKTKCDLCGREIGNSGYAQHRKKCEKEHETPPDEKQTPEHVEAELVDDPRKTKKEAEDMKETKNIEPTGDTIRIIEDTKKEGGTGIDKILSFAADLMRENKDLLIAIGTTYIAAKTEAAEAKNAANQEQQRLPNGRRPSPYGEW